MKKNILLLALAIIFLVPNYVIQAQEPEESPDNDNQVTENLKKRLQETLQDTDQNIVETFELPTTPRAFVGTVEDIIQDTISSSTKDGLRYITTDEDTTIIRSPGNKVIDSEDVQIEDFIIAMGYLETTEKLRAKRIIVSASLSSGLSKTTGRGIIQALDNDAISLTTIDSADQVEIILDSSTLIKSKDEIIDIDDLAISDAIIYTADIDDGELTATIIMLTKSSGVDDKSLTDQ